MNGEAGPKLKATPRLNPFRKKYLGPKIPDETKRRQGQITSLAFLLLGGRERAIVFLNTHDEELGGRPLDIALASREGFERIERAIRDMSTLIRSVAQ